MALFVLSDIHGRLKEMLHLLHSHGLIDEQVNFTGKNHTLVFLGDYTDRGEHGKEVLDVVMRLCDQAPEQVHALLGNHDLMLLAAALHADHREKEATYTLKDFWLNNGGQKRDLKHLKPHHIEWLQGLPVLLKLGEYLFMHADSLMYLRHGRNIRDVNWFFHQVMRQGDGGLWSQLIEEFTERRVFFQNPALIQPVLAAFGGSCLIHGHTPIHYMLGIERDAVLTLTEPYMYANGKCINVDGGLSDSRARGVILELP
ncbi:metallophosphoesterase [Deinococcus cellulosilyticus]|uniref:Calcineurin-like phosphoesterase domain-containing protein n=1 Tax=Deinococcus cellulosilyticus (strain DSM 18568 / NBRC 106333 / KACC 11606 / 5516J-15) TaxID=1223518 RepID=A0A511N7D3_DEIC1|nr:metallophosphoesterase [Deinococcus cellulosilyticus]GEM48759.1 hypothetical protein DC3_43940 [Deinococcus cellulosilyticus NBRC 106333 = KACC 11606]